MGYSAHCVGAILPFPAHPALGLPQVLGAQVRPKTRSGDCEEVGRLMQEVNAAPHQIPLHFPHIPKTSRLRHLSDRGNLPDLSASRPSDTNNTLQIPRGRGGNCSDARISLVDGPPSTLGHLQISNRKPVDRRVDGCDWSCGGLNVSQRGCQSA